MATVIRPPTGNGNGNGNGNGGVVIVLPDNSVSAPPSAPEYGLAYVPEIDFAVKDPTLIEAQVIIDYETAFLALTGVAKTLAPGDPVRLLLLTVVDWLARQRVVIDFTGKSNLLKYARQDYLDNLAALHGQRALRLPASPAWTTLRFSLEAPMAYGVIVPAKTMVQAPNGITFRTVEAGSIAAGALYCDVAARSVEVGIAGNGFLPGQINSIVNWNQPFALQVINTTESEGGSDIETDEQYRYRIWLAIESYSTCGPRDAYEFWALSAHPEIMQCVVHSEPNIAGEVHLYPLLKGGKLPTQDILDLVLAKCSADTVRPLTDYVFAHAPTVLNYTLNMTYWVLETNHVLLDAISQGVTQAVADWILWQKSYVGRDINIDELTKRCLQAGAKRIDVTTPVEFQLLQYNQLAVHTVDANDLDNPVIGFGGLEAQ